MPSEAQIAELVREIRDMGPHSSLGPLAVTLTARIRTWFKQVWTFFRGDSSKVTGALKDNISLWRAHLRPLPKQLRSHILHMVIEGYKLPWMGGSPPLLPIRVLHNSSDLHMQSGQVWRTLSDLIDEHTVEPWDLSINNGLPMGMSPIKWVTKTGTSKVRVVFVLCAINRHFRLSCGKCELDSLHKTRHIWCPFDWQLSTDKHNSFHHVHLHKDDITWCGFSLHPSELPSGVAQDLIRRFGSRYNFVHKPTGRLVFVLKGLPQGATASTAVYNQLSQAVLQGFLAFKHGSQVPRGTVYVDDFKNLMGSPLLPSGLRDLHSGFRDALIFWQHFLVRMVRLGFFINIEKTPSVPLLHGEHLGLLCSTTDLMFRETQRGAIKLHNRVRAVRDAVRRSSRVPLKLVAALLGSLYSRKLLMHRAVPIMTRAMFDMLAVQLRLDLRPWFRSSKRLMSHMAQILKHAWTGTGLWTADQEAELCFWENIPFLQQQAPMNFDKVDDDLRQQILKPTCENMLKRDVRIVAADTSDHATGIAEFELLPTTGLCPKAVASVPLACDEVTLASVIRELLGCTRAVTAFILRGTSKQVVLLCDNLGTVYVLKRSSSIPFIARIMRSFFIKCFKCSLVVIPIWLPRAHSAIRIVDAGSRLRDRHSFHVPPLIFWRANRYAIRLWGCGFQIDRAATFLNVMPIDRRTRLPFNSMSHHPFSSGLDMFRQDWSQLINWCNPPFHLIGRILSLLKRQRARAAIVVPTHSMMWWHAHLHSDSPNVSGVLHSGPIGADNIMRWPNGAPLAGCKPYRIVFLDFALRHGSIAPDVVSAEQLPVHHLDNQSSAHSQIHYNCLPPRLTSALSRVLQKI